MALLFVTPAYAQSGLSIDITMPPAFELQEITHLVSPVERTRFAQIARPNEMLGAYLSPEAIDSLGTTANNLPEELVIVAVPKGNPTVTFQQFPLLKKELIQQMQAAGAIVFANDPYWLGTTKQQRMGEATYLFSTAAISVKDRVLMVQVLKTVTSGRDVEIHHQRIKTIVDHLIAINTTNQAPLAPSSLTPASSDEAQAKTSKPKLYVTRP